MKSKREPQWWMGVGLCVLGLGCGLRAGDWPQWGGTDQRNMYSPAKGLPDRFEPGEFKAGSEEVDLATTKNVKWVGKLGTKSYGNVTEA